MKWSVEEDELLIKLWESGLSASKIALCFSGRTKNSILGRVHRIALKKRGNPIRMNRIKEKPSKKLLNKRYKGAGVKMVDLTQKSCRWPLWASNDEKKLYCGKDCKGVYCKKHSEIAYSTKKWKNMYLESWQRKDNVR